LLCPTVSGSHRPLAGIYGQYTPKFRGLAPLSLEEVVGTADHQADGHR